MRAIIAASALAVALASDALADEQDTVEAYNTRMLELGEKTRAVNDGCEARRTAGEFKSEAAVIECANPDLLIAYIDARVLYLDLMQVWLAAKLDAARKLDKGEVTREQYDLSLADWKLKIAAEEDRRKKAAVDERAGREPEAHTPDCHKLNGKKYCF
jgi:hypothetical protein